jgi:hypothetical protein
MELMEVDKTSRAAFPRDEKLVDEDGGSVFQVTAKRKKKKKGGSHEEGRTSN